VKRRLTMQRKCGPALAGPLLVGRERRRIDRFGPWLACRARYGTTMGAAAGRTAMHNA